MATSFLDALAQIESSNINQYSKVDKDVAGPNSRSQGYFQINTPTWHDFAGKAGVDLNKYPNAMSAPRDVQAQVASQIPLSRFGPRTLKMLGQQFGQFDKSATVGSLNAKFGGGASTPPGTTLNTNPSPQFASQASVQGAPQTAAQATPQGLDKWLGQGGTDALQKALASLQPQSANIAPMQAPNLQVHQPQMMMGGLGGLGGFAFNPYDLYGGYYGS